MLSFTAGILLALVQAPAVASDERCITDQMSAADRAALGESARRAAPTLGPAGDRLRQAAATCRDRFGWPPDRTGALAALSLSLILRDESGRILRAAGIPPERIDRWFDAQDVQTQTDPEAIEPSSRRLVVALQALGHPIETVEAQGHMIGIYFGSLVVIERVGRGLPLN